MGTKYKATPASSRASALIKPPPSTTTGATATAASGAPGAVSSMPSRFAAQPAPDMPANSPWELHYQGAEQSPTTLTGNGNGYWSRPLALNPGEAQLVELQVAQPRGRLFSHRYQFAIHTRDVGAKESASIKKQTVRLGGLTKPKQIT